MKTLYRVVLFFVVFGVACYFGANYALKKLAAKAVVHLKPKLEQKGIVVEDFSYSKVRLNSFNSAAVIGVSLDFHLNKKIYGNESYFARFHSRYVTVRFADFNNPSFFFTFKDFSFYLEPDEKKEKRAIGKLENGYLTSRIPLHIKDTEGSAREILSEVKTLFNESKSTIDVEITADVLLEFDEKEVKVGLFSERKNDTTFLRFNDKDIMKAAEAYDLDLAEKEAEIISKYPGKVPMMIKITRDAKNFSKKEKEGNSQFPEDAYRHIYWSYNLTRELGPELAKEITDAHETIPGNTPQERQMDYHNNAIGQKYASKTMDIEAIKNLVLHSAEVIRFPSEVDGL